ncbi:STAS domain-containing protein [Actinophytocola sp.]|uniref:STAS domain-containing protein n=1 Tax=Actinophytocola sp. TaxID=1872138 RepID=UPI002D6E7B5F|nr:STAS domain-containing protein [Actinophytocola sp.]HYQ65008.1 STAS domain-containing protein [Actinophytocola sp.]
MTALLPHLPNDRPSPASAARPDQRPVGELLSITTHPAPLTATVLTVRGEVDALTSPELREQLLPHVRGTVPHVIVDLTGVSFLAAAGLAVLVSARQTAVATGIALRLVVSTHPVLLPLRITGLDAMFDISPDLTQALLHAGCGPDG